MWKLEIKKMAIRPYFMIAFCIALLLFVIYLLHEPGKSEYDLNKEIYKEYLVNLEGKANAEKAEFIHNELEKVNAVIEQEDEKEEQYLSDEISAENYKVYLKELKIAEGKVKTLIFLDQKASSFDLMEESNVGYFYELDVQRYLHQTIWNPFLLAVLVIFCFSVCLEDRIIGIESMIQTSKYGRWKLIRTRMAVAAIIALVVALIMGVLEWKIILRTLPNDVWNLRVSSRVGYETDAINWSVGMCLVIKAALKCIVSVITAVVISCLQVRIKR